MNPELLRHLLNQRFLFLPPFLALAGSLPQEPKQEAEGSRDRPKGSDGGRFKRHGLRRVELLGDNQLIFRRSLLYAAQDLFGVFQRVAENHVSRRERVARADNGSRLT